MVEELQLDTQLRWWVLLPIFGAVFLYAILCNYLARYVASDRRPVLSGVQVTQALLRSKRLRTGGATALPPDRFAARLPYYAHPQNGIFVPLEVPEGASDPMQQMAANPAMNPGMMMDQMKGSLTGIVPYLLFAGWVRYLFAGFVLLRVPFPLTSAFKTMLQNDIALESLEAVYVSSLSWYLLAIFGLRSVVTLLMGAAARNDVGPIVDQTQLMQQQMAMMGQMNAAADPSKQYKAELENLSIAAPAWALEGVEARLLRNAA